MGSTTIVSVKLELGKLVPVALIQFVPPSAELANKITRAREDAVAHLYAENGYWYDAMAALSHDINRQPDRHQQRADLLEQVGLMEPAAFDRSAKPPR